MYRQVQWITFLRFGPVARTLWFVELAVRICSLESQKCAQRWAWTTLCRALRSLPWTRTSADCPWFLLQINVVRWELSRWSSGTCRNWGFLPLPALHSSLSWSTLVFCLQSLRTSPATHQTIASCLMDCTSSGGQLSFRVFAALPINYLFLTLSLIFACHLLYAEIQP